MEVTEMAEGAPTAETDESGSRLPACGRRGSALMCSSCVDVDWLLCECDECRLARSIVRAARGDARGDGTSTTEFAVTAARDECCK